MSKIGPYQSNNLNLKPSTLKRAGPFFFSNTAQTPGPSSPNRAQQQTACISFLLLSTCRSSLQPPPPSRRQPLSLPITPTNQSPPLLSKRPANTATSRLPSFHHRSHLLPLSPPRQTSRRRYLFFFSFPPSISQLPCPNCVANKTPFPSRSRLLSVSFLSADNLNTSSVLAAITVRRHHHRPTPPLSFYPSTTTRRCRYLSPPLTPIGLPSLSISLSLSVHHYRAVPVLGHLRRLHFPSASRRTADGPTPSLSLSTSRRRLFIQQPQPNRGSSLIDQVPSPPPPFLISGDSPSPLPSPAANRQSKTPNSATPPSTVPLFDCYR